MFSKYKIHKYKDYDEYRHIQTEGNKRKLEFVWAVEENIAFLSEILKKNDPRSGLCHGVRNGTEQEWFRRYIPSCEVIGTDISETATQFPNTIQWDFHEVKPEWIGHFDFIYSNSFDHTYDPEKCMDAWMSCLSPKGVCVVEHSSHHSKEWSDKLDPFGASIKQMPKLIKKWGKGRYAVADIVKAPVTPICAKWAKFIFIKNI